MNNITVDSLEDVAPLVEEHLLPEIQESVEACVSSYEADVFNDLWTFGTQLWKNTWNRLKSVAKLDDCPFERYGKGNEYKLKIGPYILRHHKIDHESRLPTGAKAVKESAAIQLSLFSLLGDEFVNKQPSIDNIVIAIDANPQKGLKEVFIGELLPYSLDSKKFKWGKKIEIYLAKGEVASNDEFVTIHGFKPLIPAENIPEVTMRLVQDNTDKQEVNSNIKK